MGIERSRHLTDRQKAIAGVITERCAILHRMRGPTPTPALSSSRRVVILLAAAAGLLLAACSSPSNSTTTTSKPPHSETSSTPTVPRTSTTTTTTLPTSGPLTAGTPIAIPLTANQILATEGPDGAVFVAAQAPASPTPSIVYVVDGTSPAAITEHMSSGVAALAADASNLYVATYSNVTAYNRNTGNQDAQWTLPTINTANSSNDDLVAMAAGGGSVLVSITQGNAVSVYRIDPGSSAAPALVVQGLGDVVGSDGTIYYESTDHHLVALSSSGGTTTGPLLADTPNGLGGGVQYVNFVAGGAVWVGEPAGQGLDSQWTTYATSSLAQVGQFGGTAGNQYVDTAAGPLVLSIPEVSSCPQQGSPAEAVWCVSRITLGGTSSNPLPLTPNAAALVGPYPVAIESTSTALQLIRIT
jgi:hypothetical protein